MNNVHVVTRALAPALIIKKIKDIISIKGTCIVAIDGNSGAGKSTFASHIAAAVNGSLFHTDDFFLPPKLRTAERLNTPGGNVDSERFNKEVICGILSGNDFTYKAFSCQTGKHRSVKVAASPISIIEGVYSHHPLWSEKIDLKIFMSVDHNTQVKRILSRNGAEMLLNFTQKWIPLENKYFEFYDIPGCSHIKILS